MLRRIGFWVLTFSLLASFPGGNLKAEDILLIDDFEGNEIRNSLGWKANVYVMAPSRIMLTRKKKVSKRQGGVNTVLEIKYDKHNTGGPYGMGGWCGYYTLLKNEREGTYLDASEHKAITFMVRGEEGGENFKVGLADKHWESVGDSLKSDKIDVYVPEGKITTEWQKATIPFNAYFLDFSKLSAIAIAFESDVFPEGEGSGIVYIDDIALE